MKAPPKHKAKPVYTLDEPEHQTPRYEGDPRGAAVYILFPGDIRDGQTIDACYTNGVAVY